MFTTLHKSAMHRRSQLKFADFVVWLLVALLAGATLFCLIAISPAVWTAIVDLPWRKPLPIVQQCVELRDDAARLQCFDSRVPKTPPHPAKGANAPLSAFEFSIREAARH